MPKLPVILEQKLTPMVLQVARYQRANPLPEFEALWNSLRANHLNSLKFRRKYILNDMIVDFYCPKAGLMIELDNGGSENEDQKLYNRELENLIALRRERLLRFTYQRIRDELKTVLIEIADACEYSVKAK